MALFVIAGRNFHLKERREQGRDAMQRHHSLPGAWATLAQQQLGVAVEHQYPIIRLLPGSHQLFVHIETKTAIFDLDSSSFVDGAEFISPGVGRQTYPMQTGHVLLPQR